MTSFDDDAFWSIYNTNFLATYQNIENNEEALEKYQEELLTAFNLKEYSSSITEIISRIYERVQHISEIDEIVKFIQKENRLTINLDLSFSFVFLWGFDTFHLIHACLSDYKNTRKFNKDSLNSLKELLKECI